MASAGALRTTAVVVVVAAAALSFMPSSSHGRHQKTCLPLCSNCTALCNSNCSSIVAAECSTYCNLGPSYDCLRCRSYWQDDCPGCCGNTTSGVSCCGNGCVGDCPTCGCDCASLVDISCSFPCRPYYPYNSVACDGCHRMAGEHCFTACNATCYDNCVDKDKQGC